MKQRLYRRVRSITDGDLQKILAGFHDVLNQHAVVINAQRDRIALLIGEVDTLQSNLMKSGWIPPAPPAQIDGTVIDAATDAPEPTVTA